LYVINLIWDEIDSRCVQLDLVTFVINLIWDEIDSRCVQSGYVANVINLEIDSRGVQSDANDTETSFITSLVWAYSYNMMRFHSYLDAQDSKWLSISS
jgi:hypothetical protein